MKKIKKGDEVIVIAGKEKGKKGIILSVLENGAKVIVDGLNMVSHCVKANPNANIQGGIELKAMPIHISNVMFYDSGSQKGTRVGVQLIDGHRQRVMKSSKQVIETKT